MDAREPHTCPLLPRHVFQLQSKGRPAQMMVLFDFCRELLWNWSSPNF